WGFLHRGQRADDAEDRDDSRAERSDEPRDVRVALKGWIAGGRHGDDPSRSVQASCQRRRSEAPEARRLCTAGGAAWYLRLCIGQPDPGGCVIERTLIIRAEWLEMILDGTKDWEIRSTPARIRG